MFALACVATFATAGCGLIPGAGAPAVAPSLAEKTATVSQYASALNGSFKSIRETWTQFEEDLCMLGGQGEELACVLAPMAFDMKMQTLVLEIDSAQKEGSPVFIGKPPAEIEDLVFKTREQAAGIDALLPDGSSGADDALRAALGIRLSTFMKTLDAWEPYI